MANWITRVLGAFLPTREAVYGPADDFWYSPVGQSNYAGVTLRPDTAMAVSAVYSCIRVLRESLGSLPLKIYRWTDEERKEKEQARDHYVWKLLQRRPNVWQTPQEWKELGVNWICLRGAYINRIVGTGDATQLIPLSPDRTTREQQTDGTIIYVYRPVNGPPERIQQDDILDIRGVTINGVDGVSILEFARNSIGSSIAQEKHGSTLVGKGAVPPFWISRPAARRWTSEARKQFRENWKSVHGGADNAANPPILGDDMEIHPMQISNRDLQFIEGRQFNAEEICGFFGVHPALVFKSKETAGNNEEISQQFKTYTLGPLAIRFEQAVDRDLLDDGTEGNGDYFARFNLDALTRATMKDRYEAHNVAVQGGWKLVNEVRDQEDMNPIDGGDESRFPLNMQPAGGGPDRNEQGGQPGKGQPKEPETPPPVQSPPAAPRKRRRATKAAFRILLREAAGRIAAAEIHGLEPRAARAAEDRDMFNQWAKKVYIKHLAYILKTLNPISCAWASQTKRRNEADLTEQATAELLAMTAAVLDESVDVPSLLEDWKTTRADELAKTLEGVFFNGKN